MSAFEIVISVVLLVGVATPLYLYIFTAAVFRAYFREKMLHHKALLRELSEGD